MWRCDACAAFAMSAAVLFPPSIIVNTSRSIAAASVMETRAAQRSPTNFIGVTEAPAFFVGFFAMSSPCQRKKPSGRKQCIHARTATFGAKAQRRASGYEVRKVVWMLPGLLLRSAEFRCRTRENALSIAERHRIGVDHLGTIFCRRATDGNSLADRNRTSRPAPSHQHRRRRKLYFPTGDGPVRVLNIHQEAGVWINPVQFHDRAGQISGLGAIELRRDGMMGNERRRSKPAGNHRCQQKPVSHSGHSWFSTPFLCLQAWATPSYACVRRQVEPNLLERSTSSQMAFHMVDHGT